MKSVKDFRREYTAIRKRSHCANAAEFDTLVKELLDSRFIKRPTPTQWVDAAEHVHIPCRRCCETGDFVTGTLNGQPTGPGGVCYRCAGKGYQTDADARRNYGADMHAFSAAAQAMLNTKGEK